MRQDVGDWSTERPGVQQALVGSAHVASAEPVFFVSSALSRQKLPWVAVSGEKDESGVRVNDCTGTVKRAHSGLELGEEGAARLLILKADPAGPGRCE